MLSFLYYIKAGGALASKVGELTHMFRLSSSVKLFKNVTKEGLVENLTTSKKRRENKKTGIWQNTASVKS